MKSDSGAGPHRSESKSAMYKVIHVKSSRSQIQNDTGPFWYQIFCYWASWTRWSETVIFVVFFVALRDLSRLDPAPIDALDIMLNQCLLKKSHVYFLLWSLWRKPFHHFWFQTKDKNWWKIVHQRGFCNLLCVPESVTCTFCTLFSFFHRGSCKVSKKMTLSNWSKAFAGVSRWYW